MDHKFTVEFRIENMSQKDYDKLINLLKDVPNVKYKQLSKTPLTQAERTSI